MPAKTCPYCGRPMGLTGEPCPACDSRKRQRRLTFIAMAILVAAAVVIMAGIVYWITYNPGP